MITWIVIAVAFFGGLIWAAWWLCGVPPRGGRHARLFADPAEVPDTPWLRQIQGDRTTLVQAAEVHHELSPFPEPGRLELLPPDPPPDETAPLPVVVCELGMSTQDYVDGVFAPAEASLNAMVAKYAEVTA